MIEAIRQCRYIPAKGMPIEHGPSHCVLSGLAEQAFCVESVRVFCERSICPTIAQSERPHFIFMPCIMGAGS